MAQTQAWYDKHTRITLNRLKPRLLSHFLADEDADDFGARLDQHFPRVFRLLHSLYQERYDFFYHLEQTLLTCAEAYKARTLSLKELDQQRLEEPLWFQSHNMVGAVCYVDLFAGDLKGLEDKLPYLQELGITYLHLMPLFKMPAGENDGGYAISDYRNVHAPLGTMKQLAAFAAQLRELGISLVLDFVFNHTSDEHTWAQLALSGDEEYQDYYYMFPDRNMPDAYEATLREIFPQKAPGNFTYNTTLNMWVWTTFHNYQWDLNYSNPAVFNAMLGEMLFLANIGVEVLRLDAVAFIWKQIGTSSENLPQAHTIIQALNALVQIVAPAMHFKSEAIVHPRDIAKYISKDESPLSYNPTLMALLWESLATSKATLLRHSMSLRFDIANDTAWVNYVRVHDDIGWTFADEDAAPLGINGYDHRQFLNSFYVGDFRGSFARGVPFGFNPLNKDVRISGTAASLAGLEHALETRDDDEIERALNRLLLLHSIIISVGGIPLIYLGDEIATLNDYSYLNHPDHSQDSRWVHRPKFDWARAKARNNENTVQGYLYTHLKHLIDIRKENPIFAGNTTLFFDVQNPHVFAYLHNRKLLVLCNFSATLQSVQRNVLDAYISTEDNQDSSPLNLLTNTRDQVAETIQLEGYQFKWLLYT